MVPPGKRSIEFPISGDQGSTGINVTGCADFVGNAIQPHRLTPKPVIVIDEC
jgi:hypothetical protein